MLLTFEKRGQQHYREKLERLENSCQAAGIKWHRLTYHNQLGVASTIRDIAWGSITGLKLARHGSAEIVHARSYIAGLMALAVKKVMGAQYVFDMRGFWPDERVEAGIWKRRSLRSRHG